MDASLTNLGSELDARLGSLPKLNVNKTRNMGTAPVSAEPVSRGKTPVTDTVEITAIKSGSTPTPAVFDPTATGGPFEQKHIGGVLATSSAIDGYNGWEAMLEDYFGIQNGGDKSDMPVISSFNWADHGPNSIAEGYIPANALSQKMRNLIANMYVYAHDHGLNKSAIMHLTTPAHAAYLSYKVDDYDYSWIAPKNPADRIDSLKGRDAMVEYLRRGTIDIPDWFYQPEEAAQTVVDILSSEAINDNLIPKHLIVKTFGDDYWGDNGRNTIKDYQDIQKLIYAYSRNHSDGKPSSQGAQSPEAQHYIAWREANFSQMRSIIAEAQQPTAPVPGSSTNAGAATTSGNAASKEDAKSYFDRYSSRIKGLVASLDDSQKTTLGELYKLASKKGGGQAMEKVDALAKAMVTANFMEVMLLPGKDKDGKNTPNLLDMLVWTKDLPDQNKILQTRLTKKAPDLQKNQTKIAQKPLQPTDKAHPEAPLKTSTD